MKRIKPEHARPLERSLFRASSGVEAEETQPSEIVEAAATPALPPVVESESEKSIPVSDNSLSHSTRSDVTIPAPSETEVPVMQRLRQKAQQEAENGVGAPKGKHPYEYSVASFPAIPAAFRDENGDVDHDKINTHLQDLYDHDRSPIITGLMIGRRVHN